MPLATQLGPKIGEERAGIISRQPRLPFQLRQLHGRLPRCLQAAQRPGRAAPPIRQTLQAHRDDVELVLRRALQPGIPIPGHLGEAGRERVEREYRAEIA